VPFSPGVENLDELDLQPRVPTLRAHARDLDAVDKLDIGLLGVEFARNFQELVVVDCLQ